MKAGIITHIWREFGHGVGWCKSIGKFSYSLYTFVKSWFFWSMQLMIHDVCLWNCWWPKPLVMNPASNDCRKETLNSATLLLRLQSPRQWQLRTPRAFGALETSCPNAWLDAEQWRSGRKNPDAEQCCILRLGLSPFQCACTCPYMTTVG